MLPLFAVRGAAQDKGNALTQKGYVGNVGLSITPCMGLGADVTTAHGYSFGNGLWMGGGVAICFFSDIDGTWMPVYTGVKYTFMKDEKISPFLDCRLGCMTNLDDTFLMFNPGFGVDIDRFSIFGSAGLWGDIKVFNIGFYFNFL